MPNDIAHLIAFKHSNIVQRAKPAGPFGADSTSVRELLSRNGELALHNRQLTVALARLKAEASTAMERLTPRQQPVMALVLEGHPSKNIAADLCISQRTVENHRAAIMRRTGAASLPALVRLSLCAQ
jgi:two-component system, chemotaxis family, CheB/CheR fusion protein